MKLLGLALGMFAFGFLLVPLYDAFCEITGLGGRTNTAAMMVERHEVDQGRSIIVEFVAAVNQYGPWEFRPAVASMQVHPGQLYDTSFFARNLTNRRIIGQAVPSVAPGQAAKYFRKTECFCFTSQEFAAQESRDLPLQFIVDPDLPAHIDRLSLSYTIFVTEQVALGSNRYAR
jgi:cytochrome c oxidase assembly protein subunit 11